MDCKEIKLILIDYADNLLSEKTITKVDKHIEGCENCRKELEDIKKLFKTIKNEQFIQPSEQLKTNFSKMLTNEIIANKNKENQKIIPFNWSQSLKIVASILLLISAFLLGKHQTNSPSEVTSEKKEILALLENISASKRILAVTKTETYTIKDTRIIDALINKLFLDKNVNVRLAATEALSKFSSLEKVRNALIKALETEKEPSIQIELIQILAAIQEKRALNPMKELLKNETTPNYVKQQLAYNIPSLL